MRPLALLLALAAASQALADGPPAAEAPPVVALMPLRPLGVRPDAALALESTFRAEVARLPEVKLADAGAVRKALRGERDCIASLSCAAGAASLVGAQMFVVGTVGALGELYILDLKLLDARSGSELRRVSRPVSGKKDQLIEAVRAMAVELLAPARYAGSLYVEAFQGDLRLSGVELFVDGKSVGKTPMAAPLAGLAPGQHALRVSREGTDLGVFFEVRVEHVTSVEIELAVEVRAIRKLQFLTSEAAREVVAKALEPQPAAPAPPSRAAAGESPVLASSAPPPAPRSAWLRVAGFSALGVGVVAAVVGVAFHARAYTTAADLNRREQENRLAVSDLPSYADINSEVRTARILYVVSGLLGAGGAAALFYDHRLEQQQSWRATPIVAPRTASLVLTRGF